MAEPQPVFVDGPLRGQDYPVPRECISRGVFEYRWYDVAEYSIAHSYSLPRDVSYQLRQYGIFRRVIWVWTIASADPDPDDLFDLLMSPAAKAAVFKTVTS